MNTPSADDAATISRRIAEMQAERDAARNCSCDVREDGTRIINPTCPTHGQSGPAPAAMQHFAEDDWQRLKQAQAPAAITVALDIAMIPIGVRHEMLRERLAELGLIRLERPPIVQPGDLCPHHPHSTMSTPEGMRWCFECDWQVEL